ncbi:chloride channel protein [Sediminibacterium roseum]|uniref:Chloride channel protein n=1 Tax=Sediminibacterium roseum TaxID=1978412 RepID=A0ABW9ZTJ3_9BACT|nr:chloride channel protein [Sediminibacterium roseum]NCI50319.1 chloride channel protein [Sediminibacterium roseum]
MAAPQNIIRVTLKRYFDKIRNEKIKKVILQALPFWLASLLTGVIAVLYTWLFQFAENGAVYLYRQAHWHLFILTPACFLLSVWMVRQFSPYAKGSGIPQVTAAIELSSPKGNLLVDQLLNLRIIVVKIISSCIMALGGGIIGREGPTIQIAGSVFRKVNRWLPGWWPKISKRNMIMTGAAAGLAAAFNTPLGGIVFAMEELTKTHISFYKTAIFSAVIIAGLTAQSILGPYLYLGYPDVNHLSFSVFLVVILVAIVCGLFSSVMCKLILRIIKWKTSLQSNWKVILYVTCCGLFVAGMGYFTDHRSLNSGKELMTELLFTSDKYTHWYTPLLRMAGSVFSFTTGAAGGVFAPALSSGATIGSVFSGWLELSGPNSNIVMLAGMVAFLTGITRSPFTSAILVLEMTDGHHVIFHLMLAAMVSNLVAYFIDRHSFYDHIKVQYIKELAHQEDQAINSSK